MQTTIRAAAAAALALAGLLVAGCAQQGQAQAAAGDAAAAPAQTPVQRGQYLVAIMGCSDCHTPGGLGPKPDMARFLGGSDVDFVMPGMGVFSPPNLTPDKATGLGGWTTQQIVTAFTTGKLPDGRVLSPAMPWGDFAHLTPEDATAIALDLQSLPPVVHKVPGPAADRSCVPKALQCLVQRE
jgi:mono/diheme cytochrome c family protein